MYKPILLPLTLSLCLLFSFSITIHSQNFDTRLNLKDTTQTHLIVLKNGDRLKGRIFEIQNNEVSFFLKKNQTDTTLLLSQIYKIKVKGHLDVKNKKYLTPFQYTQYLFFVNTAFGIPKKETNYRTFLGASMLLDYGLADGFSVGVAYSFPFLLSANAKLSGALSPKFRLGYKSQYLTIPTLVNDGDRFWIFENTLMMTFGSPNHFFNIAATNYWTKKERFFDIFGNRIPAIYNSISLGGGYRLNERWQFIIENHINFNIEFIDAKVLPSIGLSYATSKFNFAFGFQSPNQLGYNLFPILDINDDDFISFVPQLLSKMPYFTYSKIF